MQYLHGLNDAQKEAVLTTEGPVSVLAGAGSGKTKVLTTRIYHLIRNGTPAERILAVTFTNKAAREMRERLSHMLDDAKLPTVVTFHGLGRILLERFGSRIDVPRYFAIFDRDDSERAIKEALKALDVDPKEVPPRAILSRISKAKGDGLGAKDFRAKHAHESFRARITAECWVRYEETLKREKSLDFDDLIALPATLLREHADIREQAQQLFSYIHVDEFQDTNALQAELANMLSRTHKNIFVVGDIDQCLIRGTKVTVSDGSARAIETLTEGDEVLSNYGGGRIESAKITRVTARSFSGELVRIRTESGRELVSTPEHTHFAGYRLGIVPQKYFTYLMYKKDKGWRLGVSQTYTRGQRQAMIGFQQRCNHEHGDAVWIVGVHETSQAARVDEYKLSLSHSIPTLPFVARTGSVGGYVHDQKTLDEIFSSFDTGRGACNLLAERGLSYEHPHHRAQATRSSRRNIVVALCGDRRGTTPMHTIALSGSDAEGRELLQEAGFSIRTSKLSLKNWRYESCFKDYAAVLEIVKKIKVVFPDAHLVQTARLGGKKKNPKDGSALPFLPAGSVLPGMAVFGADGEYDIVQSVERVPTIEETVYDIDIAGTHNFIANGITTHNCIYTWRGATIENLLSFEDTYPGAHAIVLAHNYRSTKTIVDTANRIIEKNRNRKEKVAVTDNDEGEPVRIHVAFTADGEARWIADEVRHQMLGGVPAEEIAVLYRTNFQSRALEEAMLRGRIPYKLLGTRFLDRKEVKDVLAWVRLALEPTRETDRMRAVQFPARGIGKVTLGKLAAGQREVLKAGERAKVEAFESLVNELHDASQTMEPSAFVRLVIERSGMEAALQKGGEEDAERLENVKELATLASRYDATPGTEGVNNFLADTALAGDQDEIDRDQSKTGVTLMTVHASKGLEFETVFVTGLEEGLFPHQGMDDEKRDEEEERRLFYVAVTRARKRLILTLARVRKIYGVDTMSAPSSFIHDIDEHLLHLEEGDEHETIIE